MNVVTAYKWQMSGKGIVVTILDDGIEKDHPDLRRNYVRVEREICSRLQLSLLIHTPYVSIRNVP